MALLLDGHSAKEKNISLSLEGDILKLWLNRENIHTINKNDLNDIIKIKDRYYTSFKEQNVCCQLILEESEKSQLNIKTSFLNQLYFFKSSKRFFQVSIILMFLCGTIITLFLKNSYQMAHIIASLVPKNFEHNIGKDIIGQLSDQIYSDKNNHQIKRVKKIIQKLTSRSQKIPFSVYLWNSVDVNAFAFLGQNIVITVPLLEKLDSDDELAAIIAHEITHIRKRHPLVLMIHRSLLMAIFSIFTGDFSALMAVDPSTVYIIASLQYSREMELEADLGAYYLLKKSQYQEMAFVSGLKKISEREIKKNSDNNNYIIKKIKKYFQTHPETEERIRLYKDLIRKM